MPTQGNTPVSRQVFLLSLKGTPLRPTAAGEEGERPRQDPFWGAVLCPCGNPYPVEVGGGLGAQPGFDLDFLRVLSSLLRGGGGLGGLGFPLALGFPGL